MPLMEALEVEGMEVEVDLESRTRSHLHAHPPHRQRMDKVLSVLM